MAWLGGAVSEGGNGETSLATCSHTAWYKSWCVVLSQQGTITGRPNRLGLLFWDDTKYVSCWVCKHYTTWYFQIQIKLFMTIADIYIMTEVPPAAPTRCPTRFSIVAIVFMYLCFVFRTTNLHTFHVEEYWTRLMSCKLENEAIKVFDTMLV